jgi:hypothetical protein
MAPHFGFLALIGAKLRRIGRILPAYQSGRLTTESGCNQRVDKFSGSNFFRNLRELDAPCLPLRVIFDRDEPGSGSRHVG